MELTISKIDSTPLHRRVRIIRWINGQRVKTRLYFDDKEPTTGPIRKYPQIDLAYFQRKARARDPFQVTLKPWTDDNRD